MALVRERYSDFGPKLAHEKLLEVHGLRVGRETLRKWLTEAGVWLNRASRAHRAHQPRHRRHCLGELVQIDGCEHAWFEDRGPPCALLVYVHFKRRTYLIEPNPETLDLARRRVRVDVHEAADGTVVIRFEGSSLPYDVLDKQPHVGAGDVVEHKRLGAVLSLIQAGQAHRDDRRLASRKLTLRDKARLREMQALAAEGPSVTRPLPATPASGPALPASNRNDRLAVMRAFFERHAAEQKARTKAHNDINNQRKRDRELELRLRRQLP